MTWVFRRPEDLRPYKSPIFALLAVASAAAGISANTFGASATLDGTGALAGIATLDVGASGNTTGDNPIAGTCGMTMAPVGLLRGTGALAGSLPVVMSASASADSVFGLTPNRFRRAGRLPVVAEQWEVTRGVMVFPYSPPTAFEGRVDVVFGGNGLLRGAGRLIGSGANVFGGTGILSGTGALAGSAAITINGEGPIDGTGSGSTSGASAQEFSLIATLDGLGAMVGYSQLLMSADGPVDAIPGLDGVASLSFSLAGRAVPPNYVDGMSVRALADAIKIKRQ